jgi:hypothetical protein
VERPYVFVKNLLFLLRLALNFPEQHAITNGAHHAIKARRIDARRTVSLALRSAAVLVR